MSCIRGTYVKLTTMFLIKDDFWQIKKTKERGYGVFARKEIKAGTIIGDYLGKVIKTDPGEELTISYLLGPKDESCNPCTHSCKCKSEFCTGTMHLSRDKYERWQKFQNNQKKKTKKPKAVFGKNLPKLAS